MFIKIFALSLAWTVFFTQLMSVIEKEIVLAQLEIEPKEESVKFKPEVNFDYVISERWFGGYRVEIDISGVENADSWQGALTLPQGHTLRDNYGILVSEPSNGTLNFSGDEWNSNLEAGERTTGILIVDGNSNEAAINFTDYKQEYGTPQYSSHTQVERDRWREEIASDESLNESKGEKLSVNDSSSETEMKNATVGDGVNNANVEETTNNSSDIANESFDNNIVDTSVDTVESTNTDSSDRGKFRYGEVLQKNFLFLMANRSGNMGSDNLIQWRSNSTMNDGSDVGRDLEGGYFDAGDHIKFVQPMTYTITQLAWSGIDYKSAFQRSGQFDELLNAVKHGTDYFLKTHETNSSGKTERLWVQVSDKSDHYQWVAPEEINKVTDRKSYYIDSQRPGTEAAAGTASALASASMLFRGVDEAYADKMLKGAIQLYDFAETYRDKYSDSVPEVSPMYTSWSGFEDELVLGAVWLYRATGNNEYLTKAEEYFRSLIGRVGTWAYATDDHSYAALTMLAKESNNSFFKNEFAEWADNWLEGTGGVKYSPGGMAVRAEWASAPLALSAAYLMQWYSDFVEYNQEYSDFATRQVNYQLGDNPLNYSYVIGFGDKYPLRPHHRGSSPQGNSDPSQPMTNIIHGALVGGLRSNDDYSHQDRRDDWVTNEVGTGYNAPLAASVIQQYNIYGGEPLSEEQLNKLPGVGIN